MMTCNPMTAAENDVELVAASLSGNRDAFGQIVSRYQSLICSLAYSATGSLSQSEDLAQETFFAAWKQLRDLREPEKLRSWLCGMARNLINNSLRRQGREPSHAAELLENISEPAMPDPLPFDQAIGNEEQAILWRSLEQIPQIYRDPLVLFYRENQSIQRVAEDLELSEDTVKQRLSRGRKLLHEQVLAFVEGALRSSAPGKIFTIGVVTALPGLTISAKAAALGVTAAKGSATAKTAGAMGLFGALFSPLLAFFGMWIGYRMKLDSAQSEPERNFIKNAYKKIAIGIFIFFVAFTGVMFFPPSFIKVHPTVFTTLVISLTTTYLIATIALVIWSQRSRKKLESEHSQIEIDSKTRRAWEHRSKLEIFGLPFFHIRIGGGIAAQKIPVKAWIAIGDCAFGLLFAFGGIAIAPVSIGGMALGLFSFGGCSIGLLAWGGFSLGIWSFGGLAVGWQAFGGCAIAWNAAMGGCAIAHDFALGGIAQAAQANNKIAEQIILPNPFFKSGQIALRHIAWLNLIWVIPMIIWWRKAVSHQKTQSN